MAELYRNLMPTGVREVYKRTLDIPILLFQSSVEVVRSRCNSFRGRRDICGGALSPKETAPDFKAFAAACRSAVDARTWLADAILKPSSELADIFL